MNMNETKGYKMNTKTLEQLIENANDFIELRYQAHNLSLSEVQDALWLTEGFLTNENQKNAYQIVFNTYTSRRASK